MDDKIRAAVMGAAASALVVGFEIIEHYRSRVRSRSRSRSRTREHIPREPFIDRDYLSFAKSLTDIDSEENIEANYIAAEEETESKEMKIGKRSSSSTETSSQARSHWKRNRDEDSHIQLISGQLREIAVAIRKLSRDQIVTSDLYEEVMKIEGFEESLLVDAFDYLVENEKQAKAYMAKSVNLRKAWIEKFINQR